MRWRGMTVRVADTKWNVSTQAQLMFNAKRNRRPTGMLAVAIFMYIHALYLPTKKRHFLMLPNQGYYLA